MSNYTGDIIHNVPPLEGYGLLFRVEHNQYYDGSVGCYVLSENCESHVSNLVAISWVRPKGEPRVRNFLNMPAQADLNTVR